MSDIAIRITGISKRYRIDVRERHTTLRDVLADTFAGGFRRLLQLPGYDRAQSNGGGSSEEWIWALRDVSLEVRPGEVLGIIGRNGAGKSTLLKILSRITEPTTGEADVHGRLGSLLEVGTGFHPELTGRENIYLQGAILGMKRAEIGRRFEEIVEFAGISKFLDTPVKRYSSGMYVRLAFAVAAHFEPEILVVDEVLAVGDAEFQRKCLGKLESVTSEGRTVLFVSHNMNAIQRLCPRSVLLDRGRLDAVGPTSEIVQRYFALTTSEVAPGAWLDLSQARRSGSGAARFLSLRYGSEMGASGLPRPRGPLEVRLEVQSDVPRTHVSMAVFIADQHGSKLINADSKNLDFPTDLPQGRSIWAFTIQELFLRPGLYLLGLWLADRGGDVLDRVEVAARIEVIDTQSGELGVAVDPRYAGVVICEFQVGSVPLQTTTG
jgi:ABC-type polysaccharide/polyol phosphate transport system ATPase subunit